MSTRPRRGETAPEAAKAGRRRLPGSERRAEILAAAADLFAEEGFGASTRALATRLGITQAALYRHFPGKDAIVDALLEERASRRRAEDWSAALAPDGRPLVERLGDLYARLLGRSDGRSLRLFVRAGLDRYGLPARRGAMLTAAIFEPVVGALRQEAGLPAIDREPMRHEEREIAMTLHGANVFLAIRKHVYRMALPDDLSAMIRRQVRIWLPGAVEEIRRLHAGPAGEAVPQLAPRPQAGRPRAAGVSEGRGPSGSGSR